MDLHRIVSGFLLLAGGVPALAGAQTISPQAVEQINAATRARVRLVAGDRAILYGPRVDSVSLVYERSQFPRRGGKWVHLPPPLPIAQVTEIQVVRGSHAGSGAKIGAGIGAGLVFFLFLAANTDGFFSAGDVLAGTLIAGVGGAALGALLGSASPRWGTVYPTPAP